MVAPKPATQRTHTMPKQAHDFTIAEAAQQLGFTRQYLYKLIDLGKLQPRVARKTEYRLSQADIDELRDWLEGNR
jgi:excisionase family DNA binding protein